MSSVLCKMCDGPWIRTEKWFKWPKIPGLRRRGQRRKWQWRQLKITEACVRPCAVFSTSLNKSLLPSSCSSFALLPPPPLIGQLLDSTELVQALMWAAQSAASVAVSLSEMFMLTELLHSWAATPPPHHLWLVLLLVSDNLPAAPWAHHQPSSTASGDPVSDFHTSQHNQHTVFLYSSLVCG